MFPVISSVETWGIFGTLICSLEHGLMPFEVRGRIQGKDQSLIKQQHIDIKFQSRRGCSMGRIVFFLVPETNLLLL